MDGSHVVAADAEDADATAADARTRARERGPARMATLAAMADGDDNITSTLLL